MATPTPKIRVRVDWDNDGDFSDANSDVSDDVLTTGRGMKIVQEIKLRNRRSPASILELYLKNDDHKYSPTKATSAIYPYTLPGPYIWVQMGYPVDTFDVSDDTTLENRTPDYDSNFAAWAGDTTRFKAASNQMLPAATGNYTSVLNFLETDCHVAVEYTRGGTTSGLILRYSDASNYLMVYHDGTNLRLGEVVSGTLSSLAYIAYAWTSSAKKTISAELHGNQIFVSVNDTLQISHTTTRFNTATKYGIGGRGTHANDRWDNFGGWRSMFYGRIDKIEPKPENHNQFCIIRAMDDRERMKSHLVFRSAPSVTESGGSAVTADLIIGRILDAVDFSSSNRILDEGTDLNASDQHEKSMGRDGLTELYQVQDDDVGLFYLDGAGYARYEESGHRTSAPHTTVLKTWRGDNAAGDQTDMVISNDDFSWNDGKENVENEIYFEYSRISRESSVVVWQLEQDDNPAFAAGDTLDFTAVGDGDNVGSAVWPVHDTDFDVNTSADGTGTNILAAGPATGASGGYADLNQYVVTLSGSSDYTINDEHATGSPEQDFTDWNDGKHQILITDNSATTALAWIGTDNPDGDGSKVTLYTSSDLTTKGYAYSDTGFDHTDTPLTYKIYSITVEVLTGFDGNFRRLRFYNGSGVGAFIIALRLRADKGTASSKVKARAESSSSQDEVGRRRIEHKTLHVDTFTRAQDRAGARIKERQARKEVVQCTMPNKTRACLMQAVHRSVSERINLVFTAMGIADDMIIEGKTIEVKSGGQYIQCYWTLQQVTGGAWDTVRWNQFQWA